MSTEQATPRYLIVISGGQGAGKSTLASKLFPLFGLLGVVERLSLAEAIRDECKGLYPQVDWFNKSQSAKNEWHNCLGMTMREFLVKHAEAKVAEDKLVWLKKLDLKGKNYRIGLVDDLRKNYELGFFRQNCGDMRIAHLHIDGGVGDYDFEVLSDVCDIRLPAYPCDHAGDWLPRLAEVLHLDPQSREHLLDYATHWNWDVDSPCPPNA